MLYVEGRLDCLGGSAMPSIQQRRRRRYSGRCLRSFLSHYLYQHGDRCASVLPGQISQGRVCLRTPTRIAGLPRSELSLSSFAYSLRHVHSA